MSGGERELGQAVKGGTGRWAPVWGSWVRHEFLKTLILELRLEE